VTDEGVGMDGRAQGGGLRGIKDRVEALGGELEVGEAREGRGVRLAARIPILAGEA
jgi:signal transduction histidine kinase